MHRINGVRQLFTNDSEVGDPSVSSTTQFGGTMKGKKEPPQPPPPPLAPLSNNMKPKPVELVLNEDSDSIGNHSLSSASGVGAIGIVSSTEDNDNSLTSFEGLLNGMPIVEETLNESSSNSKDSVKNTGSEISIDKPLRLADLLEKKFDKSPTLNGTLNKDLKLNSEKSDLIENHIEKALSEIKTEVSDIKLEPMDSVEQTTELVKQGIKRHATEQISDIDEKKPLLSNINGSAGIDLQAADSSSNSAEDRPSTVSTAAAKLFADFAADILEDEDEDQLIQETQPSNTPAAEPQPALSQQLLVDNNQQVLLSQSRQIIVSQPQIHSSTPQVVFSSGEL